MASEVVHDNDVAGLQRRDETLFDIGFEALAIDRPSKTHGAAMPSLRRAARKVSVFQWPCGTRAESLPPLAHQPRSGAMLILAHVSSMKTRREGSILP